MRRMLLRTLAPLLLLTANPADRSLNPPPSLEQELGLGLGLKPVLVRVI